MTLALIGVALAVGQKATMTTTEPKIVQREALPYVAIRETVKMQDLSVVLPTLWPEVAKWLADKGAKPAGPPLIRFLETDMEKGLLLEVGFPVAKSMSGDARVLAGVLPKGRYVTVFHQGDYKGLVPANGMLQEWAKKKGVRLAGKGVKWTARFELYPVDPGDTPDASKWETHVFYLIDDGSSKK